MNLARESLPSGLAPDLIAAYRAARYRVAVGFELTIDTPNAALAAWQVGEGVCCSALITASNPASQPRSEQWNRSVSRQLEAEISRRALAYSPTVAMDPADQWPVEPGFLIAGLAREPAEAIGRSFDQNAIVWAGTDAVPRLVLLR